MSQKIRIRVLRFLRKIHSLLGVIIFPLVLVVGLTGFYLNHSNLFYAFVGPQQIDETSFNNWPDIKPVTIASVAGLAKSIWPNAEITRIFRGDYHNRPSLNAETQKGTVIVSRDTGHYYVKTRYTRKTFDPDGTQLHSKTYWGTLFKGLHTRGWPSDRFGTLLSDLTSIALMVFALSGAIVWWVPRIRRLGRKTRPQT